jgi:hypothetical protein
MYTYLQQAPQGRREAGQETAATAPRRVEKAPPPEEWPGSRPGPWREAEWEREKAAATLVSSGNGRERRERQGGGVGCNCNAGLVEAATIGGRKLRPEFD